MSKTTHNDREIHKIEMTYARWEGFKTGWTAGFMVGIAISLIILTSGLVGKL